MFQQALICNQNIYYDLTLVSLFVYMCTHTHVCVCVCACVCVCVCNILAPPALPTIHFQILLSNYCGALYNVL